MRIELFYDVVSPYSRALFAALGRWAPRWGAELVLRPFFLGGVMKATGNTPPAMLAARVPYLLQDLERLSRYFDVKLVVPDDFPHQTLTAMRVLTQVEEHAGEHLLAATEALFERSWGGGGSVNDPAVIEAALLEAGLDAAQARAFLQGTADPAVKARLLRTTEEAVERGAFGAPTYFVRQGEGEEHMFFGSDRLPLLAYLFDKPFDGPVPGRPAAAPALR